MGTNNLDYSEDALVEQPTIALFAELGWQTANCLFEQADHCPFTGRETTAEVVLTPRLRATLDRLNPGLPAEAYDQAVEQLTRNRSAMAMAQANREVYRLPKEGVPASYLDGEGEQQVARLRVVDVSRCFVAGSPPALIWSTMSLMWIAISTAATVGSTMTNAQSRLVTAPRAESSNPALKSSSVTGGSPFPWILKSLAILDTGPSHPAPGP